MNSKKNQTGFSFLYEKYCDNFGHTHQQHSNFSGYIKNEDRVSHPFVFLRDLLSPSYSDASNLASFDSALLFYNELKTDVEYSYNCFELEFSFLLEKKGLYLNSIINYHFDLLNEIKFDQFPNQNRYSGIIFNAIMGILIRISNSHYNVYINSTNRKKLSKWVIIKEPIFSFVMKKHAEDKWFKEISKKYLKDFIILNDNSFETFKLLFQGKHLDNKIKWKDNKSSLCYFIYLLINSKTLSPTKNKHWLITSEFFLLKGESIAAGELVNQKHTTDIIKREKLEKFVNALKIN